MFNHEKGKDQLIFSSLAAEIFLFLSVSLLPLDKVNWSSSSPVHLQGPVSEHSSLAIFHSLRTSGIVHRGKKRVVFFPVDKPFSQIPLLCSAPLSKHVSAALMFKQ